MKVIELLNKIANGEIEANKNFCYKGEEYRHIDNLFGDYYVEEVLNNDVEVIEEDKKIEKADLPNYFEIGVDKYKDVEHIYNQCVNIHDNTVYLQNKLNEIIDKINEGE